jgi:excisionase family DNA binding protein
MAGASKDDGFARIREQYPPILTTAQVAELLDLNARTVLLMAADGRLPASRLPGSRKFHFFLEDVLDTLKQHRVTPPPPPAKKSARAAKKRTR